jgi:hypothetical protein
MRYQLELALNAPGALPLLAGWALAAAVLFLPVSRLFGLRPVWTLLALLSLAPILAFTLPSSEPGLGYSSGDALRFAGSLLQPDALGNGLNAAGSEDERVANLLLFIPAGVFGTLATRRGWLTALLCAALSFGIECWQAGSGVRVAALTDLLYNSAGALIGAVPAAVLLAAARLAARRPRATDALPAGGPDPAAGGDTTLVFPLPGRANARQVAW